MDHDIRCNMVTLLYLLAPITHYRLLLCNLSLILIYDQLFHYSLYYGKNKKLNYLEYNTGLVLSKVNCRINVKIIFTVQRACNECACGFRNMEDTYI